MDTAYARQVADQLPLGEAVLEMFDWLSEPEFLNHVFETYRGRSYEGEITFPLFFNLIGDALLEYEGSGRKSFQHNDEQGALPTSIEAVYGKLRRIPLPLSTGLLSEGSARLHELYPAETTQRDVPASLEDLEIFLHDGKTIKHVARRLKALQKQKGKPLGGRLVVTQSYQTGMVVAMGAAEDGHSGESPLVPDVLAQTRAAFANHNRLHVGDRLYGELAQMQRFAGENDYFLVRWNRKAKFERDESWQPVTGTDRYGRDYLEEWGWVGSKSSPQRRYVRRIWLYRCPEKEDVVLLTNLDDPSAYPADDLLEVYLERWGIERTFQQVTKVFHLKALIGSTPKATVFQAAFCFLLYNMIQIVRAYIAEGNDREVPTISTEQLFDDVRRQLTAWTEVLTLTQTVPLLSKSSTAQQIKNRLVQLLFAQWSQRWIKAPSNTHKQTQTSRSDYPPGGHVSIFRAIQAARGHT